MKLPKWHVANVNVCLHVCSPVWSFCHSYEFRVFIYIWIYIKNKYMLISYVGIRKVRRLNGR